MTTKLTFSTAFLIAVALCSMLEMPKTARAEGTITRPAGGGEWGVNRRVTSVTDCIGAKGTFVMDFGLPSDAAGQVTAASNPQNSSPSFYFGGSGPGRYVDNSGVWHNNENVEVDAGLQWNWLNTASRPRGWVAFISVHKQQTNPTVYNESIGDYVPWRGTDRAYNLDYRITSLGEVKLNVSNLGTFYWRDPTNTTYSTPSTADIRPEVGERVMDGSLNAQRVKKVIALTRGNSFTDDLDGSWLECVFRNGRLVHSNGVEEDWTRRFMDVGPTGYDAPGNDATGGGGINSIDALRNGVRTTRSRYKVDFPKLNGAVPSPGTSLITAGRSIGSSNATEIGNSRYNAETVRINLRTFQSLFGRRVRVGP